MTPTKKYPVIKIVVSHYQVRARYINLNGNEKIETVKEFANRDDAEDPLKRMWTFTEVQNAKAFSENITLHLVCKVEEDYQT